MEFNLQTAIIFILCINIVLFVGGVRVVEGGFLDNFVDTDSYTNNQTITLSDKFTGSVPQNYENTGNTNGLSFIDTLGAVKDFLIFVVNIIFTPIGLFISLPSIVGLILGVPMLVGGVLAFLYFVRSGR